MLSVEQARARILERIASAPAEWVLLSDSQNRVLATDLAAKRDQPPSAVSAMDGYAVREADIAAGEWLTIVGEVAAGHSSSKALAPGEAMRIFTGGVVPQGADAILIQENADRQKMRVRPTADLTAGTFIRPAGLDFRAGTIYIDKGTLLDARHQGLASSLGHAWINVRRKPRVGIFTTGDELVWPGTTPAADQIASSNTACLAGLVRAWGGEAFDLGIVRDRRSALEEVIGHFSGLDMIVSTGGASVGDHDLVREVFSNAGMVLDFWKIAMRPGKPLICGQFDSTPFLGLPGNPVSAAVCAIVFLRAAIRKRLGLPVDLPIRAYRLADDLLENGDREHYMRAQIEHDAEGRTVVRAATNQDSSMFATFAMARLLLIRPCLDPARRAGEQLDGIDLEEVVCR